MYRNVRVRIRYQIKNNNYIFTYWRCPDWLTLNQLRKELKLSETKTARNKAIRSKVKTSIKRVEAAVAAKDAEAAKAALLTATSDIDKAAKKGIYHKNNAARKVSRLASLVNTIA